jgi:hypothetical protein
MAERVIVTKRRIYCLAPDEQGQPVEEALHLPPISAFS